MSEQLVAKIARFLGVEEARRVTAEAMRLADVTSLGTPGERLRFARELILIGGALAAIGNAIAVDAILEGGEQPGQSGVRLKLVDGAQGEAAESVNTTDPVTSIA